MISKFLKCIASYICLSLVITSNVHAVFELKKNPFYNAMQPSEQAESERFLNDLKKKVEEGNLSKSKLFLNDCVKSVLDFVNAGATSQKKSLRGLLFGGFGEMNSFFLVNRKILSNILGCAKSSLLRDVCSSKYKLVTMPHIEDDEVFCNSEFKNREEIQLLMYSDKLLTFKRQWCAYKTSSENFIEMARNNSSVCSYIPSSLDQKEYICSVYDVYKGFEDRMEDYFRFKKTSGKNTSWCCIPSLDSHYLEHLEDLKMCLNKIFDCVEKIDGFKIRSFLFDSSDPNVFLKYRYGSVDNIEILEFMNNSVACRIVKYITKYYVRGQDIEKQYLFSRILESLDLECNSRDDFLKRVKKIMEDPLILSDKDDTMDDVPTKEDILYSLVKNWINTGNFDEDLRYE